MKTSAMRILLAEDDAGQASLIQRNLRRAGVVNEVIHVLDGQEALDFFSCQEKWGERMPDGPILAVIDINMPRVDGIELLKRLKEGEATAAIPVIMLTTTDDPREIERCYELGCSVYITKPVDHERFVESIRRLGLFLEIVVVPSEPRSQLEVP